MRLMAFTATVRPYGQMGLTILGSTYVRLMTVLLEKGRLIVLMPFMMMIGILGAKTHYLDALLYSFLPFAGVVGWWLASTHKQFIAPLVPIFLSLFIGACLLPLHGFISGTSMWQGFQTVKISGHLEAIGQNANGDYRILLGEIVALEPNEQTMPRRARLIMRFSEVPQIGDRLAFHARLTPVPKPDLPGAYDAQFHGYFDGIGTYGRGLSDTEIIAQEEIGFGTRIQQWRQSAGQIISNELSDREAAFAKAVMVGDQRSIEPSQRDIFARTGLSHMLAISGLHLSIVAWAVFVVCRRLLALSSNLTNHVPIRSIAAICGVLVALGYLALSGFSISATRATIMMGVIFIALILGRRAITMRNVAVAALVILLFDPTAMFTASYQLSFAAVIGLIGYFDWRSRINNQVPQGWQKLLGYFTAIATTSLIAGLFTIMFSLWHFGQAAPLGVIANLGAMPIFGLLIMPLCMIALILMPFSLHQTALDLAAWGIGIIHDWANWLDGLNFGPENLQRPSELMLLVFIFALSLFAIWPGKWRALGFIALLPILLFHPVQSPPDIIVLNRAQHIFVNSEDGFQSHTQTEMHPRLIATLKHQFGKAAFEQEKDTQTIRYLQRSNIKPVSTASALRQACNAVPAANIIISKRKAPSQCNAKLILDADHFAQYGATYIWLNKNRIETKTAIKNSALPWRQ